MDCSKLMRNNVLATCGIFNAGIEADLFLIPYDSVSSMSVLNDVCTGFTLKAGEYAVRYTGKRNAYDANFSMVKGAFINGYEQSVICRTYVKSQQYKEQMNRLRYCRVIVIVKNADSHNLETKYEIYGSDHGLAMSEIDWTGNAADGWLASFTLSSVENESSIPVSFYNTDLQTTYLLLLALTQLEYFTLNISLLNSNMKLG